MIDGRVCGRIIESKRDKSASIYKFHLSGLSSGDLEKSSECPNLFAFLHDGVSYMGRIDRQHESL